MFVLLWLAAVVMSAGHFATDVGWWQQSEVVSRAAATTATWAGVVVLARRAGGRFVVIGLFAAVVLALVVAFPEEWALAGAAVTAACVYGVLGMLLTRPAGGLRVLVELVVCVLVGVAGALVVSGYDVGLRPFRFRMLVLAMVFVAAFVLAWRLGHGVGSLGRRGLVLIIGGGLLVVASVAYTQAIREWGSPELVQGLVDAKTWVSTNLGAVPRPIEALVAFPALVWGVVVRSRRRQGWWMCALGSLGAAGVATSLVQPRISLAEGLTATGYDAFVGAVVGLLVVSIDRLLTRTGGRRAQTSTAALARPEPPRFAPLL
ncbi:MAG: hypothetical protein H0U36_02135 [Nocardioidaceae bacterium]|nr:hypothetical protein [Nocardioidaceae bacterium]